MNVFIKNRASVLPFPYKKDFWKAAAALKKVIPIRKDFEVSVVIVKQGEMKALCQGYLNQNKTTDVLAFPSEWKNLSKLIGYYMVGDIYLSKAQVTNQAKEFGHSRKREWVYLFVHGLLHLFGYDHKDKKEEKEMNDIAENVMLKLGVPKRA